MRKQSGYSFAFSMGQSKKLMTQRLGDWSGRETIYGGEALSTSRALLPELLTLVG